MSRVPGVERLLQVVSLLRAGEGQPVPRAVLVERVTDYASSPTEVARRKMMELDVERLGELGFAIENVAPDGAESAFVLHAGQWRLPVQLDSRQQALLVWVMAAAGASGREQDELSSVPTDLSNLLGDVPRGLDVVQSAIARGRYLRIERNGQEVDFQPMQLASRQGRWFVLGRYAGSDRVIAPRLDGLVILDVGGPVTDYPEVGDLDERLDPTAWDQHERRDAELRCAMEDLGSVLSWFPRAQVYELADGIAALRFWVRHEEALVTRVIGLAGVAWIVAPTSAAEEVRRRARAVLVGTP